MPSYRKIEAADDVSIAAIIRKNLEDAQLNLPGTAYFDPQLDCMSEYYQADGQTRAYFVALDEENQVLGGVGVAEFAPFACCAEIQKLYLDDRAKGKGCGRALMELAEDWARDAGYRQLYLETHHRLAAALRLYEKLGFREIPRPAGVLHSTMDRFYCKQL